VLRPHLGTCQSSEPSAEVHAAATAAKPRHTAHSNERSNGRRRSAVGFGWSEGHPKVPPGQLRAPLAALPPSRASSRPHTPPAPPPPAQNAAAAAGLVATKAKTAQTRPPRRQTGRL
jgi:hypothetical protein